MGTHDLVAPAKELTVVPIDRRMWPVDPGVYVPRVYTVVRLDLANGRLLIHSDPKYRGRSVDDRTPQWYRGSYQYRGEFPVPVPGQLVWEVCNVGYLDADRAAALLELIAVQAGVILAEIVPVEGRAAGGFDWSLRAAMAVRAINSLTWNWWHATSNDPERAERANDHTYARRGLVEMTEALAAAPDLDSPEWAVMPDADLDEAATKLAAGYLGKDLLERLADAAGLVGADRTYGEIRLVGVLATLYRLRDERAGELTATDASVWFAGRAAQLTVVDDTTGDAGLAKLAAAEERAAAAKGKRLLGAEAYLRTVRTGKRDRLRQQLIATGERTTQLGESFEQARKKRAALILWIDAWEDPRDGDEKNRNAVLAKMAGITRQGVLNIREHAFEVNAADIVDEG